MEDLSFTKQFWDKQCTEFGVTVGKAAECCGEKSMYIYLVAGAKGYYPCIDIKVERKKEYAEVRKQYRVINR